MSEPKAAAYDFPLWALASTERLQENYLEGALLSYPATIHGRCLMIFTSREIADEAIREMKQPFEVFKVEIATLANLDYFLAVAQRGGDSHVGFDFALGGPSGPVGAFQHIAELRSSIAFQVAVWEEGDADPAN